MSGKRITKAQKDRFFSLISKSVPVPVASEQCGFSRTAGWRMTQGLDETSPVSKSLAERERLQEAQPDPNFADDDHGDERRRQHPGPRLTVDLEVAGVKLVEDLGCGIGDEGTSRMAGVRSGRPRGDTGHPVSVSQPVICQVPALTC
jgi:hypothetical protein